jgi:hypothetical protein
MSCKHCTGPCDQGRLPCPTPDACELGNDDELSFRFLAVVVAVVTVIMVLATLFA